MHNNNRSIVVSSFFVGVLFIAVILSVDMASSDTKSDTAKSETARNYSRRGADTCLKCHDEESEFPVFPIFKTKHARRTDERTPFANLQCEQCHGAIGKHGKKRLRGGEEREPMMAFGAKSMASAQRQNAICLDCHGDTRVSWKGSAHEGVDVSCASCHRVHAARDRVLAKTEQPEVCYNCHKRERAEFYRPSVHPVRFGEMACSECHNTHGAFTASLLARPSLNQTCYGCHPEKRGPFLWEHAPVPEDCALCHTPHGSIHPALLIKRPPWLCQACHSQAGHPSVALTGVGLPSGTPSGLLLSGACTNCHSQVHGSNHPSGVKLMR